MENNIKVNVVKCEDNKIMVVTNNSILLRNLSAILIDRCNEVALETDKIEELNFVTAMITNLEGNLEQHRNMVNRMMIRQNRERKFDTERVIYELQKFVNVLDRKDDKFKTSLKTILTPYSKWFDEELVMIDRLVEQTYNEMAKLEDMFK